jgi:glycosyltransferase involved in cell wall biosynthesis
MVVLTRVIARLELGGSQLGILRLIKPLQRRGIRTVVLAGEATPDGVRLFSEAGISLEVWGGEAGMQYACSRGFVEWLRPRLAGADLVHGHMFGAWWAAAEALDQRGVLVASEHNALQWPEAPRLVEMREALRRVEAFFAHGPATRAILRRLGFPVSRIHAGRSPIDLPERISRGRRNGARRTILFAGRLHWEKGPDLLIDSFPLLRVPARCTLLGVGPEEAALRRRISELGLDGLVELPGWRQSVGEWIDSADVLVVPSRYESWSQAAVTAMGHGLPVVATNVEGLPGTLADCRGVLVPTEDPRALARAIDDVLTGARRPDIAGGRRYAERFTAERVAHEYAGVYLRVLGTGVGGSVERDHALRSPQRRAA